MTEVILNGIHFNAADGETSDFECFNEGHLKANDTGPMGMVEEMKAFIRVTDALHLKNFVDVGALYGVFSLVFTRNKGTKAIAIEPSYPAYAGLLKNIAENEGRKITPMALFLGERTGETVHCVYDWKHLVAEGFMERNEHETVVSTALDDIGIAAVDCIKIDVEGFECPVLRGAKKTLLKFRPIIFLECHLFTLTPKGETREGLYKILTDYGYRVCYLGDSPCASFDGHSHARVICYPK